MPAPLRVVHKTDPKQDILDDIGDVSKEFTPLGAGVLIVMYERGKQKDGEMARTAGGIYIPETSGGVVKEDKYQGKVGLVVALGPIAFKEDSNHQWGHLVPKIGDWIMISVGDTYSFDLPGDRRARVVEDVNVKCIVSPKAFDMVW